MGRPTSMFWVTSNCLTKLFLVLLVSRWIIGSTLDLWWANRIGSEWTFFNLNWMGLEFDTFGMASATLFFYLDSNLLSITSSRFRPRHKKQLTNNHSDVNVYSYHIIRSTNEQIFDSHFYSDLYNSFFFLLRFV